MKKQTNKIFVLIFFVFIVITIATFLFRDVLQQKNFDTSFLLGANCLLFLISLSSFFIQRRALHSPNPQAFVRGIYSSMLIKLFVCMAGIAVYILVMGGKVNQPALFSAMGLYVLYTAVEVSGLMKAVRNKDA